MALAVHGGTEPTTGTDTTKIKSTAIRKDGRYVVNGQKVWISRVQHSDWMILLARTTPLADVRKKSEGMSIFMVDLRAAERSGMTVRPIPNMVNHETNELFFENLEIPQDNLIGKEGEGFKYILDGLNAERTLIAAECIGDGYWFIDRVASSDGLAPPQVLVNSRGRLRGSRFQVAMSDGRFLWRHSVVSMERMGKAGIAAVPHAPGNVADRKMAAV